MSVLESLLSIPLKLVPNAVHAELFARAFNHLMRGQTLAERLGELDGRAIEIQVETATPPSQARGPRLDSGMESRARVPGCTGSGFAPAGVDTCIRVAFRIVGSRLTPVAPEQATVRIRGHLAGFLSLAVRAEDPDTLFFQRKLAIEGDTETGLHVKNLLDGLDYDWDAHFRAVLPGALAAGASRLRHALGSFLAGRASSRRTTPPVRAVRSARRPRPATAARPAPRETTR